MSSTLLLIKLKIHTVHHVTR